MNEQILHLCNVYTATSETFIYDTVRVSAGLASNIEVLCFQERKHQDRPEICSVRVMQRVPEYSIERVTRRMLGHLSGSPTPASFHPLQARRVRSYLLGSQATLLHSHYGPQGLIAAAASRGTSMKIVVSFHGYDAYRLTRSKWWLNQYKKWLFANPRCHITAVSEHMRETLLSYGASSERTSVCRVGKNVEEYDFESESYVDGLIVSVGRLCEKKGMVDLVNAFAKIYEKNKGVRLLIVGDGELRKRIDELVRELGLEQAVKLLGALPHGRVKDIIADAQVFVLLSKEGLDGDKEGVPTVLMEAQSMGVPVVSTLHSGIPEAIPDVNREFLVAEGDVDNAAMRVQQVLAFTHKERSVRAAAGRNHVKRNFSFENVYNGLNFAYKGCK